MRDALYEVRLITDKDYRREFARANNPRQAVQEVKDRLQAKEYKIISVERMG